VLDVGCGRGLLLDGLRRLGWRVVGTELDERAAHYARHRLGLHVFTGSLQGMAFPDDEFDLVVLWHVLEHLPCPLAVLCEVSRILRPGGLLVLAVPDFASCEAQWAGPHWFHLDVPRHLTHFTPRTLEGLVREAGLRVRRRERLCIEYDLFSFVQTVQNKAHLPPNLLYNLVRAPSARFPGTGTGAGTRAPHAWQVALVLITAVPLGLLSLLYAPLAALFSASGTLTLYAMKPFPPEGGLRKGAPSPALPLSPDNW
jgi:SAM-dependent methyltransferase